MDVAGEASELAAKLKSLRLGAGVSTRELARRAGVSQSKIVRAENRKGMLRPSEVRAVGIGLSIQEDLQHSLVRAAEKVAASNPAMWKLPSLHALPISQSTYADMEADSTVIRTVCARGIHSVLQSMAYIEALEKICDHRLTDQSEFMAVRQERQAKSFSSRRSLRCIQTIESLARPLLDTHAWVQQLESIKIRLRYPGIEFGILPLFAPIPGRLRESMVFDRETLTFDDAENLELGYRSTKGVSRAVADFDTLSNEVLWGSDAVGVIDTVIRRLQTVDLRQTTTTSIPTDVLN